MTCHNLIWKRVFGLSKNNKDTDDRGEKTRVNKKKGEWDILNANGVRGYYTGRWRRRTCLRTSPNLCTGFPRAWLTFWYVTLSFHYYFCRGRRVTTPDYCQILLMTIFTYSHLISLNLPFVSLCLEKQPKAGVGSVCPNLVNDLLK